MAQSVRGHASSSGPGADFDPASDWRKWKRTQPFGVRWYEGFARIGARIVMRASPHFYPDARSSIVSGDQGGELWQSSGTPEGYEHCAVTRTQFLAGGEFLT